MERAADTSILYLSYTGLLEPLGHSQMWGYLQKLSIEYDISLLTFEKPRDIDDERLTKVERQVREAGIDWHRLRYHSTPTLPATAWDLVRGAGSAVRVLASRDIDLIHARGHVAGALGLTLKTMTGTPLLFDMRGFWADAKVDAGHWAREGVIYRTVSGLEQQLVEDADGLVVLTEAARTVLEESSEIGPLPPTGVVPTCVDLDLFRSQRDGDSRDNGPFTLGYVGSASGRYRFGDALDCYEILLAHRPDARFHIINRGDHDEIWAEVRSREVGRQRVTVEELAHEDVPAAMQRMNAGVFFYPETKASKATSPTKMGEFLASGIPCLTNAGVGDADQILSGEDVGAVLETFDEDAKEEAVDRLIELAEDPSIGKRCRSTAVRWFSLDRGIERYDRLYQQVADHR